MNLRKVSLPSIVTAVAPLILLAIAALFLTRLWLVYCFDFGYQELRSYSSRINWAVGALAFLLACLGLLLVKSTKDRSRQESRPITVGIFLCALSGTSILLLIVVRWGYQWVHESPFGLWSRFTITGSTFGVMIFSLAYLGFLFISPARNRAWQGLRPVASSIVLYASALIGSRYWNGYLKGSEWDALFVLSPLIFFAPAALAFYLGRNKRKQTIPSPAKWHSIPIGQVCFLAYIVSLVIYISTVYIGGKLLLWGTDNDFVQLMDINIVFFFLLPVQAGALLVFSITSGKAGGSWAIVIARLALCVVFALICYSALEHLPVRLYGE
jgi:hypothetical protein